MLEDEADRATLDDDPKPGADRDKIDLDYLIANAPGDSQDHLPTPRAAPAPEVLRPRRHSAD